MSTINKGNSIFYSTRYNDDDHINSNDIIFNSKFSSKKITRNQIPIVYRKEYNIELFGLEKFYKYPYNPKRWKKVMKQLNIPLEKIISPNKVSEIDLLLIHSSQYLKDIEKRREEMVKVMGEFTPPAIFFPICVRRKILDSFKYQTGGSILASLLAMERGWSINIGGGFHHASGIFNGHKLCFYADITLAVKFIFDTYPNRIKTVLIIDLDAHPGIGVAYDFTADRINDVHILDIYNKDNCDQGLVTFYPIRQKVEMCSYIRDAAYLEFVTYHVERSLITSDPDFVIYIGGTGILNGDSSGKLSVSREGILQRDEIIFEKVVRQRNIPITMLMCEGQNCAVFAESILNLKKKKYIDWY